MTPLEYSRKAVVIAEVLDGLSRQDALKILRIVVSPYGLQLAPFSANINVSQKGAPAGRVNAPSPHLGVASAPRISPKETKSKKGVENSTRVAQKRAAWKQTDEYRGLKSEIDNLSQKIADFKATHLSEESEGDIISGTHPDLMPMIEARRMLSQKIKDLRARYRADPAEDKPQEEEKVKANESSS